MHHVGLKTQDTYKLDFLEIRTINVSTLQSAATYMGSGEDQQCPPSRDQHLGLCEVTDALFLQLHHVTYQRLHILGPVLVSPRRREPLQRVLQRLLQRAAEMAQTRLFGYEI